MSGVADASAAPRAGTRAVAGRGGGVKKHAMQVNVVVRVRPMLPHERLQPRALEVTTAGTGKAKCSSLRLTAPHEGEGGGVTDFAFEKCYDEATPQRLLFQREIQPAIARVLDGINTTVFAYGATGTGKTFTMEGSKRNLGMIPRCIKRLFEVADEEKRVFHMEMSYLEIYNNRVLDLLVAMKEQTDLPIRQQTDGKIAVQGLTKKRITSLIEFEEWYQRGSASRKRARTDMNAESSRSHSILMIQARAKDAVSGSDMSYGKLHLIDLAGSEDNRRTGNSGARLAESGKINMSLFVLGKVINALNSQDFQRIPFRDSKLTRLLQDSLGGSNHAVMICNVAPSTGMYQESLQTLQYASKAKGITNQVTITPPQSTVVWKQDSTTLGNRAKAASMDCVLGGSGPRRQRLTATASSASGVRATSLSPGHRTNSNNLMESKLSAWKQARTSGNAAADKTSSTVGIKRPISETSRLSTVDSLSRAAGKLIDGGFPRPPIDASGALLSESQKKLRQSVAPAIGPSTKAVTGRSGLHLSLSSAGAAGSPAADKENVNGHSDDPKVIATILQNLSPVELAKKLISIAIDLEKKKRFTSAYCVFKRAYQVLPEENTKLMDRMKALEAECKSTLSVVPSQKLPTAEYMQLVLEMDLIELLNKGSQKDLTKLHSIGGKRAEKIIEARPFQQLLDLTLVPGMTDKVLDNLHAHHIRWL